MRFDDLIFHCQPSDLGSSLYRNYVIPKGYLAFRTSIKTDEGYLAKVSNVVGKD